MLKSCSGLKIAVREEIGCCLLRGCSIHWARSWQRVRDKVCQNVTDRELERKLFSFIASSIQKVSGPEAVILCFEVLCSLKPAIVYMLMLLMLDITI